MDIQKLRAAGIDVEKGVKRFGGKTELYEKYLLRFPTEGTYGEMLTAIEAKDYTAAFKCAHMLKGVVGSLNIDRLYEKVVPLVEALRNNELSHLEEQTEAVKQCYESSVKAILEQEA